MLQDLCENTLCMTFASSGSPSCSIQDTARPAVGQGLSQPSVASQPATHELESSQPSLGLDRGRDQ